MKCFNDDFQQKGLCCLHYRCHDISLEIIKQIYYIVMEMQKYKNWNAIVSWIVTNWLNYVTKSGHLHSIVGKIESKILIFNINSTPQHFPIIIGEIL